MKFSRSQAGISLVEVMVAAALTSGVALTVAEIMNFTNRQVRSSSLYNDWTTTLSNMRQTYMDPASCTNMFSGISYNPTSGTANVPQLGMRPSPTSAFTNLYFRTTSPLNGFNTTSIRLIPATSTSSVPIPAGGPFTGYRNRAYLTISTSRQVAGVNIGSPMVANEANGRGILVTIERAYNASSTVATAITGCFTSGGDPAEEACSALDASAVYDTNPGSGSHGAHGHNKCQIQTLHLNPKIPAADAMITFNEPNAGSQTSIYSPSTGADAGSLHFNMPGTPGILSLHPSSNPSPFQMSVIASRAMFHNTVYASPGFEVTPNSAYYNSGTGGMTKGLRISPDGATSFPTNSADNAEIAVNAGPNHYLHVTASSSGPGGYRRVNAKDVLVVGDYLYIGEGLAAMPSAFWNMPAIAAGAISPGVPRHFLGIYSGGGTGANSAGILMYGQNQTGNNRARIGLTGAVSIYNSVVGGLERGNVPHACVTRFAFFSGVADGTLSCAGGEVAMGGGAFCNRGVIYLSRPDPTAASSGVDVITSSTGWYAICCDAFTGCPTGTSRVDSVYAICCKY